MNMLRVLLSHLTKAPRRYAPSKLNLDIHHTITESHKFSRGSVFKVDIYSRNKWIEFTKARCTPRNERSFIIERLIRGFLSKVSQRVDGRWIVGVRCVWRERLLSSMPSSHSFAPKPSSDDERRGRRLETRVWWLWVVAALDQQK